MGWTFLNMEGSVRPTDTGFLRRGDGPQLDSAVGFHKHLGIELIWIYDITQTEP